MIKNVKLKLGYFLFCIILLPCFVYSQTFSRADSLRGNIFSPLRTCYDVSYYHLTVDIDTINKRISGNNIIEFKAINSFKTIQIDLFENMAIEKILFKSKALTFKREANAVFVNFPKKLKANKNYQIQIYFSGNPIIAKNAPWDGGFTFSSNNNQPFIATSCQGIGASLWWPNKDALNDEPDSMKISVSVPKGLMNVSNGILIDSVEIANKMKYTWRVNNPINNYGVALNIADYRKISDTYDGLNGKLNLSYYVLPQNVAKAKTHFANNVKPMLKAFEYWFGAYPFYNDGYKLVETPYLGMEHQSAIAYGNKYQNGYLGQDLSETGWGLKWDFIIIHESGHEWFGNNISAKDIADAWIHEAFTTYSEALFIEYYYGKAAAATYIKGLRKNILNDKPIIGPFGVNKEGSDDRYFKGANILHTIRTVVNNDSVWRKTLISLNQKFAKKTLTGSEIIDCINSETKINFTSIFKQYLEHKNPPKFCYEIVGQKLKYWWKADELNFNLPLLVKINNELMAIYPSTKMQTLIAKSTIDSIAFSDDFYFEVEKAKGLE